MLEHVPPVQASPLLVRSFRPDNKLLAGLSGSFAPCSLSVLAGCHVDEAAICLTRLPVNCLYFSWTKVLLLLIHEVPSICRKKGRLMRQGKRSVAPQLIVVTSTTAQSGVAGYARDAPVASGVSSAAVAHGTPTV